MPDMMVVQRRDYRLHAVEVIDRGRSGFIVTVHPPANRGQPWQVIPEFPGSTLGDTLNKAKAEIDVVMGPKRPPPPRGYARY